MGRDILIYGAGGAGRELAFALSLGEANEDAWQVAGFIDDTEGFTGRVINGVPVLGGGEYLKSHTGCVALTIVREPAVRRGVLSNIKRFPGVDFPAIVCPGAIVSPFSEIGAGTVVSPGCCIQPNARIGDFVWINPASRIGHDVSVGDFATIYSGVIIGGGVAVGSDCMVGSGSIILPGVTIGSGAVVGAGSVVNRDVPASITVAGVPARPLM